MLTSDQMTPEQKIGRVLCFRRTHIAEDLEFTLEMIKKGACGCVQLALNDKTHDLSKRLREAADYPLLIVNDMERGYPLSSLPKYSPMLLAATGNSTYYRLFAAAIAKEAREAGFTGTWAPVLDLQRNIADPFATARHAGDSPEAVTAFAREMLTAFRSYHFGGSAKHYPGGHTAGVDTHMSEGINRLSEEELLRVDLAPYLTLFREGLLTSIMVDHSTYPEIDPDYPASLSKKVIGLIRREGFDGCIYTDSLAMMSILQRFGEKNAMVLALSAGNDIILPNYRTSSREVYEMMLSAYREGLIPDERLDEAVRHVMAEEARCAAIPEAPMPLPENLPEIFEGIARDAVTAVTAEGVKPAIDPDRRRLFIVLTEQGFREGPVAEISVQKWYSPMRVKEGILESFPNAEVHFLPEFPSANENDKALTAATKHDEVVFVTYCQAGCYIGADMLTRRVEAVIRAIAASGKLSAIVHFGNPLALRELPPVPRRIFGYDAAPTQHYAFRVLAGELPAKGVFPFPKYL